MRRGWCKRACWLSTITWCFTLGCGRSGNETAEPLHLATGPGLGPPEQTEETPVALPLPPGAEPEQLPDDPRRDTVLAMFERECSGCHGAGASGPIDLDSLVNGGYLVPEQGETSPLVLWFQYGPWRAEHANVNVNVDEFDALVGYTNAMPAAHTCPGYELTDRDRAIEHLLLDINSRPVEDRPFIRYVGSMPTNPRYGCNGGLSEIRAFLGFVNSVSLGPRPVPPAELVASSSFTPIFALDMRDLGWAEPVDVAGLGPGSFADHWEAIAAAASPYALELEGPEANALKREAGTLLPFVPAAAFVSVASVGALYYALVGVGGNVNAIATSLGVEGEGSHQRAGMFGEGSWPDRVVRRRAQATPGHSWWTREELAWSGAGPRPLALDPVAYATEGSEIIFNLPNGFLAFALAGSDGTVNDELPKCVGGIPCPTALRAQNSITCHACHGTGLLSFADEVLPYLDADPSRYPAELVPSIRDRYGSEPSLTLEAESVTYGSAMEAANAYLPGRLVASTYHEFTSRPLRAIDVADELGVAVEELRAGLVALGERAPELTPLLTDGSIERGQLTSRFLLLACSVGGYRNVPSSCP